MTWLAHSSLAMVLFVMSLAGGGVIDGTLAVALVLGANLGGAIVPFVALSAPPVAARRVVLGNLLVRAAGVVVAIPFVGCAGRTRWLRLSVDPARLAVNFHLAFNLALAVVGDAATRAPSRRSPRGCCRSRLRLAADRSDAAPPRPERARHALRGAGLRHARDAGHGRHACSTC